MNSIRSRPSLRLAWCSYKAAKYACEHWHYSKRIPKSKLVLIGVWEDESFRGCIIFGYGATSSLVSRYGLKMTEGAELVRIALQSHKTPVSRLISIAVALLRKQSPGIRLLISFADPQQGHTGGVYQASGWLYLGRTEASDEYIFEGRRWQGRSFRNNHRGLEHDPRVEIVKGSSKHRYALPLDAEMMAKIKPLSRPYPKRAGSAASGTAGIHPAGGGANPTPALHPDPAPPA